MSQLNLKTADVRTRIEPALKQRSMEVLASVGLDMSDAIRLFLRQVVELEGLPFEVRKPNPKTIAAMREAREMTRTHQARFETAKDLFDDLQTKGRRE